MAFSVTVSFAPLASRVVSLLYTPDARDNICSQDTSRCWISINAHAPIKDGTVSSHQFVFAWTGKNDSKTQRVRRKTFPFSNKTQTTSSPHFSSGIVERAKRERSRKGDTRRGERKMREKEKNGVIFTRARVSLALLYLRKNGDYSQSNKNEYVWKGSNCLPILHTLAYTSETERSHLSLIITRIFFCSYR